MIERLHRIRRAIGMDRAVFYTAAARGWTMVSGIFTLWFIGTYLSKPAQGFYYTFASVLGLQVFLELGLSQSLIQTASHEFAKLSFAKDGKVTGEADACHRLLAMGKLSLRWYGVVALLLILLIAPVGHWFFASEDAKGVDWIVPWWSMCILGALGVQLTPLFYLLEGCGRIASVNAARFWIGIITTLSSWVAYVSGAGLYTCVVQSVVQVFGSILFLSRNWWPFVRQILQSKALAAKDFVAQIWGFQWRIAISWICGYFSSEIMKPLIFKLQGPEVAGQVGMTIQAVSGVVALASAWTSSKGPLFGTLIAQRRFGELDALFGKALRQSIGVAALGVSVMFVLVAVIKAYFPLGARFLPLAGVGFFCIAAVTVQITCGTAVYLRAHKKEPFMGISILNAAMVIVGVYVFGWYFSGTGAALGYLIATGIVSPPLAFLIFRQKRTEWHQ